SRCRNTLGHVSRHNHQHTPLQLTSGVCRDTLNLCRDIEGSVELSPFYSLYCNIESSVLQHSDQYPFSTPSNGQRINVRKTNVLFSKGVDNILGERLGDVLGFLQVQNLGSYLGVLLFHERITNRSLRFLVEKVKAKFQSWDRQLSLVGRVTLAQPILLIIPSYFMQPLVVPKCVCEEIEHIARQFIWGNSGGVISWLLLIGNLFVKLKLVEDLVCGQHYFSIGNRGSIRCWKDSLVPRVGPLINSIPAQNNIDEDYFLREMVTENGAQNLDLLRIWLPDGIIDRIIAYLPRSFSLKQHLLTQVEKGRCDIGNSDLCSTCGVAPKDGIHAIRDYRVAKEVWIKVVLVKEQNSQYLAFEGVVWLVFFGIVSWHIWKNKIFYIFQGSSWSVEEIIKGSLSWAKQYGLSPKGVLKDDWGKWILGFNRRLGRGTIFEAELWGMLDGLSLLKGRHRGR
ncbi:hypothetical protein Goshw_000096, partial [Gossypium schwendimanii]|nr:hypothetical protein [Gossypium schwendimanii]